MTLTLCLSIFSSTIGMFQFGYGSGVMNAPQSVIQDFLKKAFKSRYDVELNDAGASLCFSVAVTLYVVGGLLGALVGGGMADRCGRKKSLLLTQLPTLLGALSLGTCNTASSFELLLLGRLSLGLASGLFTSLAPLYVSEIAPTHLRGAMGTVNQLAVTSGIFTSMVLGLSEVWGTEGRWPLLLSLPLIPAVVQTTILFFMPESPHFLINGKGDVALGRNALVRLHGSVDLNRMVEEIRAEQSVTEVERMSIVELLRDHRFKLPLFVCICLHLSQQLSGMVAIFYYSTKFFREAGVASDASQHATLGVGAVLVIMTIVTIPLMDRVGRRILHLSGLAGMAICATCMTALLTFVDPNHGDSQDQNPDGVASVSLISVTLAFVAFFALGPGSIPWLATGEVFTQRSRAAAVSVCVFVNWLGNFVVGLSFPQLQGKMAEFSFVPFLSCIIVLFVILLLYFPETKNRTPTEILALFQVQRPWTRMIGLRKVVVASESSQHIPVGEYGSL